MTECWKLLYLFSDEEKASSHAFQTMLEEHTTQECETGVSSFFRIYGFRIYGCRIFRCMFFFIHDLTILAFSADEHWQITYSIFGSCIALMILIINLKENFFLPGSSSMKKSLEIKTPEMQTPDKTNTGKYKPLNGLWIF